MKVHLGYEVGSGRAVEIPLRHMAVTGQTQEAGKTTTLEALIARSELRAVTFITKRGEGTFGNARRIAPYFREQTDWKFVASILEASRGEKLKFERAWIIRASKGARTLADVHANVRSALEKAKGLSADVYLTLDAYLEEVVPAIASVKWAPNLDLRPGVNAVDLSDLSVEMQHLVIRSAITWVLEKEQGTVVVVPEAWKFIPQGRGTPVKLAAESFVRQGAGLKNYLWLDSQDLGGIEKAILRSCAVWLLGVQRESNEIKRTLDNIPAGTSKPKAADIARLQLGQFYACWGDHVIKTYVQPAWMGCDRAHATATGRAAVPEAPTPPAPPPPRQEEPEMCEKHQELERSLKAMEESRALDTAALTAAGERAEAAERKAESLRQQAAAVEALRNSLVQLLDGHEIARTLQTLETVEFDEDAIVSRVLARIPSGGGGPITVAAPEALRLQVQRDVASRLVAAAKALPSTAKRLLKVLIALEKRVSQRQAAERAGISWGGGTIEAYKALTDEGFIDATKNGTCASVRERLAAMLGDLGAKEADVEATYQAVLYELATTEV